MRLRRRRGLLGLTRSLKIDCMMIKARALEPSVDKLPQQHGYYLFYI